MPNKIIILILINTAREAPNKRSSRHVNQSHGRSTRMRLGPVMQLSMWVMLMSVHQLLLLRKIWLLKSCLDVMMNQPKTVEKNIHGLICTTLPYKTTRLRSKDTVQRTKTSKKNTIKVEPFSYVSITYISETGNKTKKRLSGKVLKLLSDLRNIE